MKILLENAENDLSFFKVGADKKILLEAPFSGYIFTFEFLKNISEFCKKKFKIHIQILCSEISFSTCVFCIPNLFFWNEIFIFKVYFMNSRIENPE